MEKSWVDENMKNCFMLYAKDFNIAWKDDPSYWQFPLLDDPESSEMSSLNVAELLRVCWLDISGKFETSKLSPSTKYQVLFIVMIKDSASGWDIPINLSLTKPDGTMQNHTENFMDKQIGIWIEIPVGDFITSSSPGGGIEFALHERGYTWKEGLVIKGVLIKPETNPSVPIDDESGLETNPSVPIDDESGLETNPYVPIDDESRLETNFAVPIDDDSRLETNSSVLIDDDSYGLETNPFIPIDDDLKMETNPSFLTYDDSYGLETNSSVPIDDDSRLETDPLVTIDDSSRPNQNIRPKKMMMHLDPKQILLQLLLLLLLVLVYFYYYYFSNNR